MRLVFSAVALSSLLLGTACAGDPPPDASDGWQVEREVVDGVEVVRNLSGSKWGGPAQMVEELSIGVMEGDERYMLAGPSAFWATEDEIIVLDSQDQQVRVYDMQGRHLRDMGSPGQGPGELENAFSLLVTADRRVLIGGQNRIAVYALDGDYLEDWTASEMPTVNLVQTPQGIFMRAWIRPENPLQALGRRAQGIQQVGREGLIGEPALIPELDYEAPRVTVTMNGFDVPYPIPFIVSNQPWALAPSGALIYGSPDEYHFWVRDPDGSLRRVERHWSPVPIEADERDYARRQLVAQLRPRSPDFEWDGKEIPEHKPAFRLFLPDQSDRVWVSREGPSERVEDCTDPSEMQPGGSFRSCWEPRRILDAFSLDGSYLGTLQRPEGLILFAPFIRDDIMVAGTQDDSGTPMVKVYRIVLPPGAEDVED